MCWQLKRGRSAEKTNPKPSLSGPLKNNYEGRFFAVFQINPRRGGPAMQDARASAIARQGARRESGRKKDRGRHRERTISNQSDRSNVLQIIN